MLKPILVIADKEVPGEGLDAIRLHKNITNKEIGDIIHARDAIDSAWGFRLEEVLEHLKSKANNYSAILVSWFYREQTSMIKEIVGNKVPIIQYDFFEVEAKKQTVPTAYGLSGEGELSTILHNELVKSGAVAEPAEL